MFSLQFCMIGTWSSSYFLSSILMVEHGIVDSTAEPSARSSQSLVILIESAYAIIIFFMTLLQSVILVAALTPILLTALRRFVLLALHKFSRPFRANGIQRAL